MSLLRSYRIVLMSLAVLVAVILAGCAQQGSAPAGQRYRCEHGIEFTARFSGEAVALDTSRGYEMLFRDAKPLPDPPKPNEYRNPLVSVEFGLGSEGREAILRYPLLPLVARCVKDF
jgi:hypothetical protein